MYYFFQTRDHGSSSRRSDTLSTESALADETSSLKPQCSHRPRLMPKEQLSHSLQCQKRHPLHTWHLWNVETPSILIELDALVDRCKVNYGTCVQPQPLLHERRLEGKRNASLYEEEADGYVGTGYLEQC